MGRWSIGLLLGLVHARRNWCTTFCGVQAVLTRSRICTNPLYGLHQPWTQWSWIQLTEKTNKPWKTQMYVDPTKFDLTCWNETIRPRPCSSCWSSMPYAHVELWAHHYPAFYWLPKFKWTWPSFKLQQNYAPHKHQHVPLGAAGTRQYWFQFSGWPAGCWVRFRHRELRVSLNGPFFDQTRNVVEKEKHCQI